MSHHALQRVVVRMLYDPIFARAVFSDRDRALENLDLTVAERSWLTQPDHRAYATDPLRRSRSLIGLLEEYPASAALAVRATGGSDLLDQFFSSEIFHRCIQEGDSLALSFGNYLRARVGDGGITDSRVEPLACLEAGIARVRRAPQGKQSEHTQIESEQRIVLSPRVVVIEVPLGTLALHEAIRAELAQTGREDTAALLDVSRRLSADSPLDRSQRERLLVESIGSGAEVRIGEITHELRDLLEAARTPGPFSRLLAEAGRLGADPGDDEEIVTDLLAEGLLVRTPPA